MGCLKLCITELILSKIAEVNFMMIEENLFDKVWIHGGESGAKDYLLQWMKDASYRSSYHQE